MKKIIVLIAFSAHFLFAQQNIMQMSAEKKTGSEANWETTIIIDIIDDIGTGFSLSLPNGLRLIPLSVAINQSQLWLQNSESVAEVDSVVSWSFSDDGLVFGFNPNQLSSGDQVSIKAMTALNRKQLNAESAIGIFSLGNEQAIQAVVIPAILLSGE